MIYWVAALGGIALIVATAFAVRAMVRRQRGLDRLYQDAPAVAPTDVQPNFLTRWLFLAGFRGTGATATFLVAMALAIAVGLAMPLVFRMTHTTERLERGLAYIPGAVGEIFLPVVFVAPWLLAVLLATLPWVVVRRARRRRVQMFEQDLPIYLELFATLSEAGLGFDAALDAHRAVAAGGPAARR